MNSQKNMVHEWERQSVADIYQHSSAGVHVEFTRQRLAAMSSFIEEGLPPCTFYICSKEPLETEYIPYRTTSISRSMLPDVIDNNSTSELQQMEISGVSFTRLFLEPVNSWRCSSQPPERKVTLDLLLPTTPFPSYSFTDSNSALCLFVFLIKISILCKNNLSIQSFQCYQYTVVHGAWWTSKVRINSKNIYTLQIAAFRRPYPEAQGPHV